METFEWTGLFETGLPEVDQQHRRLVELVNQLGRDADSATPERVDHALQALAEYTVYHFQCEEAIMAAAAVAPAHADRHRDTHRRFVGQVGEWLERRRNHEPISLRHLLDFLANWLIFHILGDDQSMGRQVAAIRAGTAPQTACDQDRASDDPRTDILLGALRRLYAGLVARNEELLAAQHSLSSLNASLEQRVADRTAELVEANRRLREEQEKALEAEKMASLGRMVAGFAHEVNTPIGVAVGAVSQAQELVAELGALLSQEEVAEEDLRSRLQTLGETSDLASSSLRRAADMVQSFKRTAVDQTSDHNRDYELAEIIEDVQKSLRNSFKNTPIRIEVDCPPHLSLHGPAGALVQLLNNLLLNSRMHAFADGTRAGLIRIRAGIADGAVRIEYSDDGAGMSEETLQHAFEPFYTTRRATGGSGLGLYIAYNLVQQGLHGTIRCESAPGQGTRFVIDYPRRMPAMKVAPHENRP
jgi:hemerythrin-like metal-binding protein